MATTLDIIDTAVKIGLGAAISGITTYLVSLSQKRQELRREYIANKTNLLKECAFKLDESSSLRNHSEMSLQSYRMKKADASPDLITEQLAAINRSYNLIKEARSIACLVGQDKLMNLFDRYQNTVAEKADHFALKRLDYDVGFINTKTQECEELSRLILAMLANAFESMYA